MAMFDRAAFQLVAGPAIRTHRRARRRDIEIHARMPAPQRHRGIRAERRQLTWLHDDDASGIDFGHRHTLANHSSRDLSLPPTVSKNISCSRVVMGPRRLAPISFRAIPYRRANHPGPLRQIEIASLVKFFQNFGILAGVHYTPVWYAKTLADCKIHSTGAARPL